ncbi:MAG TPA: AAA family ATPase [archaeon]|nr:AAA family ATPase [archaeon]
MAVIILVGLARSGKDTAADYIVEKHGFAKYNFSTVLSKMLEQKDIPQTKQAMNQLGDMIREEMGMDAIAKLLDKKITQKNNLVLVGPRSMEEIDYFQKKFPKLKIIKIVTGTDERFSRRSNEDPKDEKKFFARDENDLKRKGFQKVLDSADLSVNNFGNKKDFYSEIETAIKLVLADENK